MRSRYQLSELEPWSDITEVGRVHGPAVRDNRRQNEWPE